MKIFRMLSQELKEFAKFPAIAVLGPRQSGKTTLVQNHFKNHRYFSFEDPEILAFAKSDPKGFLSSAENEHGLILDEFQHIPEILSYIQLEIDAKKRPGYFVLTGSQNFLMNEAISQTLAGRIAIAHLLPVSIAELEKASLLPTDVNELIYTGGYPRIYDEHLGVQKFYAGYVQTYVQRDVRQLINIKDIERFENFMGLCAGRIGQLLNVESLADDAGITVKTAEAWLSVLAASYVIYLLQPHHQNFNKRITKSSKLYFYDTGLACYFLKIPSADGLTFHPLRGNLFECLVMSDLYKQYTNIGLQPPLYFWRGHGGSPEVDCIIDQGLELVPIEIKSGQTINADYFKNLITWSEIAKTDPAQGYVIYGGDQHQPRSTGTVLGWKQAGTLVEEIRKRLKATIARKKSTAK